jgi:hypothetical protein
MDWIDFEACLAKAIRDGSVQAMKLYADLHRPDASAESSEPDAFAEVDQLAQRRAARV